MFLCVFLVTLTYFWFLFADVGEVGRPLARLAGHDSLQRRRGGQGGDVAGGPSGGVGPSGEGSSSVATERAHADAGAARSDIVEARIAKPMIMAKKKDKRGKKLVTPTIQRE